MLKTIKGMKVEFFEEIENGKENSLWFGGDVAAIKYKDCEFIITANGDVRGDIYEDGELVTSFKDKRNQASFYGVVLDYLKGKVNTDEDLEDWITGDYVTEETLKEKPNCIYLDNSNWWEIYINYNGDIIDVDCDFGSEKITEVIEELIEKLPKLYNEYILESN